MTMKYCSKCGAALPEGTVVCRNCGSGVNLTKPKGDAPKVQAAGGAPSGSLGAGAQGAPAWRPGSAPPTGAPLPPQMQAGGSSNRTGILIGCGILFFLGAFLLIVGGIGYYLYSANRDEEKPASPLQKQTQQAAPPMQGKTPGADSAAWDDLVREKDAIDITIGEVANRANQHLKKYPDFRNAAGLINDAKAVTERARKAESRAAALEGVDPARCNALRALFAIEMRRAQGLYKGMIDSSNGGDYSYGFREGTTASYAFDEANAQFDNLYR